jgi:hypothetical protein
MQSQITVRVGEDLDRQVKRLAKRLRLKRSVVVRMALERLVEDFHAEGDGKPYERIKSLLGSVSTGVPDLGEAHRAHLVGRIEKGA